MARAIFTVNNDKGKRFYQWGQVVKSNAKTIWVRISGTQDVIKRHRVKHSVIEENGG